MKRKRKTSLCKNGKKSKKKFRKELSSDDDGTKTEVAYHNTLISSNWEKLAKIVGYDPHSKKSKEDSIVRSKNKVSKKLDKDNVSHKKDSVSVPSDTPSVNLGSPRNEKDIGSSQEHENESQRTDDDVLQSKGQIYDPKLLTRAVAMDCEMVGTGPSGNDSMLARISIVNSLGQCIYDKYVLPKLKITDYRTSVSGIRPKDLKNGENFETVQKEVAEIFKGRILVGHALKNDFKVLYFSHHKKWVRDTSTYKPFQKTCGTRLPSLKKLASVLLNTTIQTGEHNSIEDARTAMQIYCLYKKEWEIHERKKKNRSVEPKSD